MRKVQNPHLSKFIYFYFCNVCMRDKYIIHVTSISLYIRNWQSRSSKSVFHVVFTTDLVFEALHVCRDNINM